MKLLLSFLVLSIVAAHLQPGTKSCDGADESILLNLIASKGAWKKKKKTSAYDPIDPANPPVRMKVDLPGVHTTAPYEYYAGYLNAGTPPSGLGTMYFHYICAMAPDWENMPLVIWYNGGPGAPSTYGLFQEFGPFLLNEMSMKTKKYKKTGIPTPIYNPWTWANLTSLCEIDSPAPMGASYCTEGNGTAGSIGGPGGDAYSCGPWTDTSVAAANHEAHKSFFTDVFPEYEASQQPVSLVGESYAGTYVPLFANAWLDDPIVGPTGQPINFKGFAIGDGMPACIQTPGKQVDWCVDLNNVGFFEYPNALAGPYWDLEFFHGHSQMSESLYQEILSTCPETQLKGIDMPLSEACQQLFSVNMTQEVGFWYAYNLMEACPDEVPTKTALISTSKSLRMPRRMLAGNVKPKRQIPYTPLTPSPGDGDVGTGAACYGSAMEDYFNGTLNPSVSDAFGIPRDNSFWVLDNGIGFNYTTDATFVGYVYEKAINAGKRVLIYEGDTDACGLQTAPIEDIWVPFFGNKTDVWTPVGLINNATAKPLGLRMTQPWRPFSLETKVQGGYVIEWEAGQVSFVSIRGGGHLLPYYRPAASFTMMKAYQEATSLPGSLYP